MESRISTARSGLEGMLSDETADPMPLPLSLLEDITGGFSDDREIGSGGFAVVYKGILDDRAVAVKRLSRAHMHEKEFHREVGCLMRVKHKNIVRFLGYCSDTQGNMEMYDGKHVMADVRQRLLCFKYMPKGSLDKYITDASLEWETCYKIIKGICEGLLYLHENHIVHMDLKPANILLDDNMVPKIADFGLSRCFNENQSQDITKTIAGTRGYLAPEFCEGGVIARSSDLYSLGVIIIEILTGQRGHQAIGDVLESWNDRLERSQGDTQCEQIRVCCQIGIECIEDVPENRPSARNIINRLHEVESEQTVAAAVPESKGKSNNGQPSVFCSVPPQTAEASASTSGEVTAAAATTTTESEGKRNTDQHRVFRSVPTPERGAGGGEGSGKPRQETLHATALLHSQADQTFVMPRPAGPAAAGPAAQGSAYELVEAKLSLPVKLVPRRAARAATKMAPRYDMVEPMWYLYVSVVRARDLRANMDMAGTLDPYVEVKLGNFKGVTKYLEKNPNPVWQQVLAFSGDKLLFNQLKVIVMDKDVLKDNFVGRVLFNTSDITIQPSSPLAPKWYRLTDRSGERLRHGELMLAVWIGTQADEAFQEAHLDVHPIFPSNLTNTCSKVYYSPMLTYLKVVVISAQDLVPARGGCSIARVQLGCQIYRTRPGQPQGSANPTWNEELMFVSGEPFENPLVVSVEEQDELLGRVIIPLVAPYVTRNDLAKSASARWFSMAHGPTLDGAAVDVTDSASKIQLRLSLETAYHVLDESPQYISDRQPSENKLRKSAIGILEVGILSARNLVAMNADEGRLANLYCVAKYGEKWVRTRTLLNTVVPHWNELHTWEVFDISTVITIAVVDNCRFFRSEVGEDLWIGKVHIRLDRLKTYHRHTHYYPLMVLTPSGLYKTGELQLDIRFICTAWVNMVTMYGKPLLPEMHYTNPISAKQVDYLRFQAVQMVVRQLQRADPPLRSRVVEYMLDMDPRMCSLHRSRANADWFTSLFFDVAAFAHWFDDICKWKNTEMTILVLVLFLILVYYPELILTALFLFLFVIGVFNYPAWPWKPQHMEQADRDELNEEFDTFPTSMPDDILRMRYDRLRRKAEKVQTAMGDLATQAERVQSLLNWHDPGVTAIFVTLSLVTTVVLCVTPFKVVATVVGLYVLRHPLFRSNHIGASLFNFYSRLPSNAGIMPAFNYESPEERAVYNLMAEHAQSLVSWRDPRMTAVFLTLSLAAAVVLYVTPFRMVATVVGLYLLRHPLLRSNLAFNFYSRLPSNDDVMLN